MTVTTMTSSKRAFDMALQAQMTNKIEMETRTLLEQWGRWANADPTRSLLFPRIEPYRRLYALPGESVGPKAYISDNLAEAVDKCMAELIQRDSEAGGVTFQYYLHGCDYVSLAERLGINRIKVATLVKAGTAWLDAKIFC